LEKWRLSSQSLDRSVPLLGAYIDQNEAGLC